MICVPENSLAVSFTCVKTSNPVNLCLILFCYPTDRLFGILMEAILCVARLMADLRVIHDQAARTGQTL